MGIGQHGYCFITDSNGEIIYHPQQQLLYSGLKTEATEGLDLSHNGSFETEELICSVLALDNCNWKVVGVSYISELVTAKEMELVGNIWCHADNHSADDHGGQCSGYPDW